jgi:hypothetical protein
MMENGAGSFVAVLIAGIVLWLAYAKWQGNWPFKKK